MDLEEEEAVVGVVGAEVVGVKVVGVEGLGKLLLQHKSLMVILKRVYRIQILMGHRVMTYRYLESLKHTLNVISHGNAGPEHQDSLQMTMTKMLLPMLSKSIHGQVLVQFQYGRSWCS